MSQKRAYLMVLVFLAGAVFGFSVSIYLFGFATNEPVSITENQVAVLNDNDYFPNVHLLLSSSNKSIHMAMFTVNYYPNYPESLENTLIQDLIDAAKRGVEVMVLTDEYLTEKPVLTYLKKNGVNIKFDSEERTIHSKLIIIDSKIVIIGSTNWSYYSLEKNREANVVIYSEGLAKQLESYFNQVWSES